MLWAVTLLSSLFLFSRLLVSLGKKQKKSLVQFPSFSFWGGGVLQASLEPSLFHRPTAQVSKTGISYVFECLTAAPMPNFWSPRFLIESQKCPFSDLHVLCELGWQMAKKLCVCGKSRLLCFPHNQLFGGYSSHWKSQLRSQFRE